MATLVFGAVGTLVGGPLGGAIGALVGRQIDQEIIGSPARQGPRLAELKASTSSYGQPIPLHAGRMRSPGTIIWSSDMIEDSETGGGGKGKPRTTSYSYAISLAVALASHPIDGVGRIWADGNLLRGAAGDLKTGGSFRLYTGHEDQAPDPLLAAANAGRCPAYRGCAYAVFEALDLTDFGNRVPALTFEIFAGSGAQAFARLASSVGVRAADDLVIDGLEGFSHDGGELLPALALLGAAKPIGTDPAASPLTLIAADSIAPTPPALGPAIAWEDGEFGRMDGTRRARGDGAADFGSLRYYDVERDYQPGVQHAARRPEHGAAHSLDFPAALAAPTARALIQAIAARGQSEQAALFQRCAEIDPRIVPGAIVRVPARPGLWRVEAWEWREGGVELELRRHLASAALEAPADPGAAWQPPDRRAATTVLRVFELPWDGEGSADARQLYAAVGGTEGRWSGAALYCDHNGALVPLGISAQRRAATGATTSALGPSPGLMVEPAAWLEVALDDPSQDLASTGRSGLAAGDNRLLVGGEILQFLTAEALGGGRWRLTGLLRGRGGTELAALEGHPTGTPATVLDERLVPLPAGLIDGSGAIAALDNSGAEPTTATIEQGGRTRAPLCPVHPRARRRPDGGLDLSWTRRARGAWHWRDGVEVPLVEQDERYEVGVGEIDTPAYLVEVASPRATLDPALLASLAPSAPVWVRQIGTHARSPALLLSFL